MTLVKFTQAGKDLYINSDHVAIVSPGTLINQTNITLVNGLNAAVEGTLTEVTASLGYKLDLVKG
jgi:hypothetical protein